MRKHLYYYPNHTAFQAVTGNPNLHNVIYCNNEIHVHYDHYDQSKDYFTFKALESGTFTFSTNALQYSLDNGVTWTTLAANTASPTVNAGSKIMWKQTGLTPNSTQGIGTFSATGNFDVYGNIMSLYFGDNFANQTSLSEKNYAFYKLFNSCNKLINAENLILPATTLSSNCYRTLFNSCSNLITSPKLLPATTLTNNCYYGMFNSCINLTTAPELPAITLANSCYTNMFTNCTSLTTAPELPARTLANGCYQGMFDSCMSLTTAPELPAVTLVENCYSAMFINCRYLNYIKAMFTTTPSDTYTNYWVNGVAASGTFVKNLEANWNVSGVNGVPTGWSVEIANIEANVPSGGSNDK